MCCLVHGLVVSNGHVSSVIIYTSHIIDPQCIAVPKQHQHIHVCASSFCAAFKTHQPFQQGCSAVLPSCAPGLHCCMHAAAARMHSCSHAPGACKGMSGCVATPTCTWALHECACSLTPVVVPGLELGRLRRPLRAQARAVQLC
jgi:hypothetical protein